MADNTKSYWQAHRDSYERDVRAPMRALLDELAAEFGPFHIFRPYQDARFAKNRPPYKEHIGALGESEGGTAYYVEFSAGGMRAGVGYYHMASDQLLAFRAALDDDGTGADAMAIVDRLTSSGYALSGVDSLKTAPRGYSADHPRITLLRMKGLAAMQQWAPAAWMSTPKVVDRVRSSWHGASALASWLDANVGPSRLPPPDARR